MEFFTLPPAQGIPRRSMGFREGPMPRSSLKICGSKEAAQRKCRADMATNGVGPAPEAGEDVPWQRLKDGLEDISVVSWETCLFNK